MDTNFISSCSTGYLTHSLCSLVRYRVKHSKTKFVSTRWHVISSICDHGRKRKLIHSLIHSDRKLGQLRPLVSSLSRIVLSVIHDEKKRLNDCRNEFIILLERSIKCIVCSISNVKVRLLTKLFNIHYKFHGF